MVNACACNQESVAASSTLLQSVTSAVRGGNVSGSGLDCQKTDSWIDREKEKINTERRKKRILFIFIDKQNVVLRKCPDVDTIS